MIKYTLSGNDADVVWGPEKKVGVVRCQYREIGAADILKIEMSHILLRVCVYIFLKLLMLTQAKIARRFPKRDR